MTVLLFVATILTFLGIDYLVRRSRGETRTTVAQHVSVPALQFPEGIFFSKTHTWLNLFPSGTVQLGVDDFVKRMFVHPDVTLMKSEGEAVAKGEAIIRMHEGANTFYVHSPIDGRITQRNLQAAARAHDNSFMHGWAYAIEPKGGASVVRSFLVGTETKPWVKSELARLRDFMAVTAATGPASVCLQDGGEPMPGVLSGATTEQCAQFERQFLAND